MSISASLEGKERMDAALRQVAARVADLRPAWPGVADVFYAAEVRQFETEGGNSGGWQPLTVGYAKAKEVTYPGKTILRATDELFESITAKDGAGAVSIATPESLTLGTSNPKARWHHPTRPVIAIPDEDRAKMIEVVRKYLGDEAAKAGFRVVVG